MFCSISQGFSGGMSPQQYLLIKASRITFLPFTVSLPYYTLSASWNHFPSKPLPLESLSQNLLLREFKVTPTQDLSKAYRLAFRKGSKLEDFLVFHIYDTLVFRFEASKTEL